MKNLFFTALISIVCSNSVFAKVEDGRWEAIATDIAHDGEPDDRGEFEAAKQALLNIGALRVAKNAALEIEKKWKDSFKLEAVAFKEKDSETYTDKNPQPGSLLSLKRYPTMDAAAIKIATRDLFEKPNIDTFLKNEGVKVTFE